MHVVLYGIISVVACFHYILPITISTNSIHFVFIIPSCYPHSFVIFCCISMIVVHDGVKLNE